MPRFLNLPSDYRDWTDEEIEIYVNSYKSYRDLKIRLGEEFPDIYSKIVRKYHIIAELDEDPDLAIIHAMSNKLSWQGKHLKITIITQYGDLLKPEIIGYTFDGIERTVV